MLCEYCNIKPAAIVLKQTIDGETKSVHICKDCASALGVSFETSSDMPNPDTEDFLSSLFKKAPSVNSASTVCSFCGMTLDELQKSGQAGCANCYTDFADEMENAIMHIHSSASHCGKVPSKTAVNTEEINTAKKIEELKIKLNRAVQREAYEEAAKYRDQIKELSEKGGKVHEQKLV